MMKMDQVLYRVGLDSEQEAEEQKLWMAEMRAEASRIDTVSKTKQKKVHLLMGNCE
eukprot:SAG31_NODE_1238_length_9176_cov_9.589181_8_plen_56_part_00